MPAQHRLAMSLAGVALLMASSVACGSDVVVSGDSAASGDAGVVAASASSIDCWLYDDFGDLSDTAVTLSAHPSESAAYERAWLPFEECTGVDVQPDWWDSFEVGIISRIRTGDAPDVALFTQPGLIDLAVDETGAVLPLFDETRSVVEKAFSDDWLSYGMFEGTLYAFPHGQVNAKSLVWYSPEAFAAAGYNVPGTWDEMIALSDQIVADNPGGRVKPWCAGIGAGEATGWPLTDWVEDVMLREQGTEYYDAWVDHRVPFNAPESVEVWNTVDSLLRNPDYVNGGIGGVTSIARTTFVDAGMPILDRDCYMMKMASFFSLAWPEQTVIAEDGQVFAFYLPAKEGATEKPLLVGADYVAALRDRPEVRAFMTYLASADYHRVRDEETAGFVSPHRGLEPASAAAPIGRLVAEQFQHPDTVIRLDGSDLMPPEVGLGSLWREGTSWIADLRETQDVLDAVEASWPS